MVRVILFHEHSDADKLASVIAEMRVLGAPEIRAYWSDTDREWYAMEGSHRLRAAHALGLTPRLVPVPLDAEISEETGYDTQDATTPADVIERLGWGGIALDYDPPARGMIFSEMEAAAHSLTRVERRTRR